MLCSTPTFKLTVFHTVLVGVVHDGVLGHMVQNKSDDGALVDLAVRLVVAWVYNSATAAFILTTSSA